jgi:hypothetical protein
MTTFIESITVDVRCSAEMRGLCADTRVRCTQTGQAVVVSTVERGDLVLVPIGWETRIVREQIAVFCPVHKGKP